MPSDDQLIQHAEEWKTRGNTRFSSGEYREAIQAYSQGVVQLDRLVENTNASLLLKTTLLSNRAACHLKCGDYVSCIDDTTTGLSKTLSSIKNTDDKELHANVNSLRSKLLFRRAKARFMIQTASSAADRVFENAVGIKNTSKSEEYEHLLQNATKDLLMLLQDDPHNSEAGSLLQTIRAQAAANIQTPMAKTLQNIRQETSDDSPRLEESLKMLMGLLHNDPISASMELGRRDGVTLLMEIASKSSSSSLSLQALAAATSHPPFVREYCRDDEEFAEPLHDILKRNLKNETETANMTIAILLIHLRMILHMDRDDESQEQEPTGHSKLNHHRIADLCKMIFTESRDISIIRACLDVVSSWTAGADRDDAIRAALDESLYAPQYDGVPLPKTQAELKTMMAVPMNRYKKRAYQIKTRNQAWAFERALLFCHETNGNSALSAMLSCAATTESHVLRREMTIVLGRLIAAIQDDPKIEAVAKSVLQNEREQDDKKQPGVIIEEVNEDDEEAKVCTVTEDDDDHKPPSLFIMMQRAELTNALLLARGSTVGAWALTTGWIHAKDELTAMIHSKDDRAMCLASELLSSASTIEQTRKNITTLVDGQSMEVLLMHSNREIRSGAASAVAKMGMSHQNTKEEGELMGLLQTAVDLLGEIESYNQEEESKVGRHTGGSAGATTASERGIEMLSYLIPRTHVKEEIAHGFRVSNEAPYNALELLVKHANRLDDRKSSITDMTATTGDAMSVYGLAVIFSNMAVTHTTVRREAFEGKEITMEEYDELQKVGKTPEQKEQEEIEKATDSDLQDNQEQCNARIRQMAQANVARALVLLLERTMAQEDYHITTGHAPTTKNKDGETIPAQTTLEQLIMAMARMAVEQSVRGIMIQQGVLSACIKVQKTSSSSSTKKSENNTTDKAKKMTRLARHVMAKLLVTTNPTLLTTAQRMGAIQPLIHLIRDIDSKDLQKFEALMAITNIASLGQETQNKIIASSGISTLHYAMFSEHDMVRRAATEAMCNLVPHPDMMEHLENPEHLRLWLAMATDYEERYECARAAAGCLAMATQVSTKVADSLVFGVANFKQHMNALMECGRPEIMHRALVLILNLVAVNEYSVEEDDNADKRKAAVQEAGLVAFCMAYVDSYHDGSKVGELDLSPEDEKLMPVTLEMAKKVVQACD